MKASEALQRIHDEFKKGMSQEKCRKCGCMKEALFNTLHSMSSIHLRGKFDLINDINKWMDELLPTAYDCNCCSHCYPAFISNMFNEAFPFVEHKSFSCRFEVKEGEWPVVAGEYYVMPEKNSPVAVTTLADEDLAEKIAKSRPKGLSIIGKTETENIGIDKIIKNIITNPAIKYLIVTGRESKGHKSGNAILSLFKNGISGEMRILGARGKKPALKNVSRDEVETFLKQVEVIDLLSCHDENQIIAKIKELASQEASKTCTSCVSCKEPAKIATVKVIDAFEPEKVLLDKAGYFVILLDHAKKKIIVEHYSYDNKLLRAIEGDNARSIYNTIIRRGWVTELFHAAYLGKELTKAEQALETGVKYVQDGA